MGGTGSQRESSWTKRDMFVGRGYMRSTSSLGLLRRHLQNTRTVRRTRAQEDASVPFSNPGKGQSAHKRDKSYSGATRTGVWSAELEPAMS